MALDSYANLLIALSNELHRADLTNYLPDFVTLADSRINADLRVRQMETVVQSTVASGVIAVPSGYIGLKDQYISSTTPYQNLQRKTAEWIYDNYPNRVSTGLPKFIGREGSNFVFGPYPDAAYVVTLRYFIRFPNLSTSINPVFTAYPALWFYAALSESAPFIKDDKRMAIWEVKYKQIKDLIQKEDDSEELSGSVLVVTAE